MTYKIRKSQIKVCAIGMFAFLFCFQNTYLASHISHYNGVINFGGMIFTAYFLLTFTFRVKRTKKYNKISLYIFLFVTIILISTFINKGNVATAFVVLNRIIIVTLALDYACTDEGKMMALLKTWAYLLVLIVLIDFCTEVMFPAGLYSDKLSGLNWFLGYKTQRAVYSFPLLFITFYIEYMRKNHITLKWYVLALFLMINVWLSQATTVCIAYFFLCILVFGTGILYKGSKKRILDRIIFFLLNYKVILAIFILVTVLVIFNENAFIMGMVAGFTGKSITFSRRTYIWRACISNFLKSPIIGLGYLEPSKYEAITGIVGGTNAHNMVLTLLISGGLVFLFMYIYTFYKAVKSSNNYTLCQIQTLIFIYASLLLGVTSSIFIFSPYTMIFYWMLVYDKNKL